MRIGFLITARLKSTRLPIKLLKILDDKLLIENVIDRIKEVSSLDSIVLCTSINKQDKELVDIAIKNSIYYFNGNEEDVLQRLLDAANLFDLDYIIGITGENPLFSIEYTNQIIEESKKGMYDFITAKGLPIGCATYALKTTALQLICKVKEVIDTEIWGYLINQPSVFNNRYIDVEKEFFWPDLRITCDYPEDYEFLTAIFDNLDYKKRLDLPYVLNYLKENPYIININKNKVQLDLNQEIIDKINNYFSDNLDSILEEKAIIYNK
jgi:spore coat polysaccharide biosynthesis protein SpsF